MELNTLRHHQLPNFEVGIDYVYLKRICCSARHVNVKRLEDGFGQHWGKQGTLAKAIQICRALLAINCHQTPFSSQQPLAEKRKVALIFPERVMHSLFALSIRASP